MALHVFICIASRRDIRKQLKSSKRLGSYRLQYLLIYVDLSFFLMLDRHLEMCLIFLRLIWFKKKRPSLYCQFYNLKIQQFLEVFLVCLFKCLQGCFQTFMCKFHRKERTLYTCSSLTAALNAPIRKMQMLLVLQRPQLFSVWAV